MPDDPALAVADELFAAIEAGDVDAVRALYADDVQVWHNTDGVAQSKDENLRVLAWMAGTLPGRRYEDVRREAIPGGFVQQHVMRATTASGTEVAMPACLVVAVTDGRITRIDEYLDSAHVAKLLAAASEA